MMPVSLRIIAATLACIAVTTAPAPADLGKAQDFVILSGVRLSFGSFVSVLKVASTAATCPAGDGCIFYAGGSSVAVGKNDKISAHLKRFVAGAGVALNEYSSFLAALKATQTYPQIELRPGVTADLRTTLGLNVLAVGSISLGNVNSRTAECRKGNDPATLVLEGTSAETVIVNVGAISSPGTLTVCGRSRIILSGGITPDRVIFNIVGGGNSPVMMSAGSRIDGGILAPARGFVSEDGIPGTPRTIVNGAILVGAAATIGNNTTINFYPPTNVGVPATVKSIGTIDVLKMPTVPLRTTTIQSEDNPGQPVLAVPPRQNLRGLSGSQITVAINNAARKKNVRRPNLSQFTNFAGLSQNGKTPSDVQFAAGTTTLVEMANVTGAVYTNPGGSLVRTFDLGQFFLGSLGEGTDPRIYYDAATANFIAAYELHPSGGDDIRLAIAPNPGVSWTVYDVANNNTGATFDQPKLGVSSDKIIISWNNYGTQSGASYIVIQKAGIVSHAGSVPAWIWSDDTSRFQIVPANQYSVDGGNHYATWHCCGNSNVDLMTFTGVPGISPMNYTDNSYGIGSVAEPPSGHQPSGGDSVIATNDDRSLSAIWQNGNLWTDFNEGCTPQGDKSERACERYVELGTPNVGVRQNVQLQWPGNDVYFSSVILDGGNVDRTNLFFGLTFSSPTQDPAALVLEVPGATFTSTTGALVELAGSTAFAACTPTPCAPRWGDYTAAARDPNNPGKVWIVNQYGGLSNHFWGTSITAIGN